MSQQDIPKYAGPVVIAAGLLPMIFAEPSEGVPLWVGYWACSIFIFAGIAMTAKAFKIKHIVNQRLKMYQKSARKVYHRLRAIHSLLGRG